MARASCGDGNEQPGEECDDANDVETAEPCDDGADNGPGNACLTGCILNECPGADIGCGYDPGQMMCTPKVPQTCLDVCVPLIPNGCDCFGCCLIGNQYVYLNSNPQCKLGDLAACNSCTFFPQCANTCEPAMCEVCFGQDVDDLPPECNGMPECDGNAIPCVETSDCPAGDFCQTGCCVPIIPN